MELTNRQILNSVEGLQQIQNVKLPVKTSFKIAKISRLIDNIIVDYQLTARQIKASCLIDSPDFKEKIEELLKCKAQVECEMICLKELGEVEIEPSVFYHLNWLIKE